MGIINWIVQKSMQKEAKKTAKFVRETYDEMKKKYPDLDGKDIHIRMLNEDMDKFNNMKEENRKYIETCCETIEGFCYMIQMDYGNLKGFMTFRLVQFTKYMDYYLYEQGFKKQTKEQKEKIMKALNIYSEDWEEWINCNRQ